MTDIAADEDGTPPLLVVVSETVVELVDIPVSDDNDVLIIEAVSELVEVSGDGVAAVVGGGVSGTASVAAGGAI